MLVFLELMRQKEGVEYRRVPLNLARIFCGIGILAGVF